ncbi:MAG TPA: WbqC family protein [Thermoanaerobaculia bacterium]|nr:WbqC family protein [Thermoanaerobaculia bacterium]
MTTLVVEQPNYVPWLGYFALLDRADLWVWYEDVQYTRRDWRNRNRVAGGDDPVWLTIPVRARGHRHLRICDVEIDCRQPWQRKHLATLYHLYGKAPFFEPVFERVRRHLETPPTLLADLTIGLNEELCRYLGIQTSFLRSSRIAGIEGTKQDRILSICRQLQPDVYLSGPAARDYLKSAPFDEQGIDLHYIAYGYDAYPRNSQPLRTDLSILDALFWIGPGPTLELIRSKPGHE